MEAQAAGPLCRIQWNMLNAELEPAVRGDAAGYTEPALYLHSEHDEAGYECPRCDGWTPADERYCSCGLDKATYRA